MGLRFGIFSNWLDSGLVMSYEGIHYILKNIAAPNTTIQKCSTNSIDLFLMHFFICLAPGEAAQNTTIQKCRAKNNFIYITLYALYAVLLYMHFYFLDNGKPFNSLIIVLFV